MSSLTQYSMKDQKIEGIMKYVDNYDALIKYHENIISGGNSRVEGNSEEYLGKDNIIMQMLQQVQDVHFF